MRAILSAAIFAAIIFSNAYANTLVMVADPDEHEWAQADGKFGRVISRQLYSPKTIPICPLDNTFQQIIHTAGHLVRELSKLPPEEPVLMIGNGFGNVCINIATYIIHILKKIESMRANEAWHTKVSMLEIIANKIAPLFKSNSKEAVLFYMIRQSLIDATLPSSLGLWTDHSRPHIYLDAFENPNYICYQLAPPINPDGLIPCESIVDRTIVFSTNDKLPDRLNNFNRFYDVTSEKIQQTLVSYFDQETKFFRSLPYSLLTHPTMASRIPALRSQIRRLAHIQRIINTTLCQYPLAKKCRHSSTPVHSHFQHYTASLVKSCTMLQGFDVDPKELTKEGRTKQCLEAKKVINQSFCY
ncbi:hypothetical protein HOD08_02025 [bacterium]|nr:hypothetical protein [bacterium]